MIKGHGYLKYLKLSLIGFGISCSTLLIGNFVSAGLVPIGQTSELPGGNICKINADLSINCSKSNSVLAATFNTSSFYSLNGVFWAENGIGLLHNNNYNTGDSLNLQGISTGGFSICSGDISMLSTGSTLYPQNCASYYTRISNFSYDSLINKLKSSTPIYWGNFTDLAAGVQLVLVYQDFYFSFFVDGYGTPPTFFGANFTQFNFGFQNGVSFNEITWNNRYVLRYPGGPISSMDGSSQGDINTSITGDYTYGTCTWNDILTFFKSEYFTPYLCYAGIDNYDLYDSSLTYNPIPGTGLTIMDLRGWEGSRAWDTFNDWFMFWNGLYVNHSDNINVMWESYPAAYHTYFDMYHTYMPSLAEPRQILEYCQILTFSPEVMNNSAGGYFKPYCELIIQEKQTGLRQQRLDGTIYSGGIYTGGQAQVPVGVNWGSGVEQKDANNFLQDFFNKAKSVIPTNYPGNGAGVLPQYIILFMLGLIFFRFLSH